MEEQTTLIAFVTFSNIFSARRTDGTEVDEKDDEPMETIEMCELVKQGEGEELETQLIQATTANGQPQLIQVVTTTNSAGQLIATPVSQIQERGTNIFAARTFSSTRALSISIKKVQS